MATATASIPLTVYSCPGCGITFGYPADFDAALRKSGATFRCPAGHELAYDKVADGQSQTDPRAIVPAPSIRGDIDPWRDAMIGRVVRLLPAMDAPTLEGIIEVIKEWRRDESTVEETPMLPPGIRIHSRGASVGVASKKAKAKKVATGNPAR